MKVHSHYDLPPSQRDEAERWGIDHPTVEYVRIGDDAVSVKAVGTNVVIEARQSGRTLTADLDAAYSKLSPE